jgi:predicted 3-demethylubiquinone-9 3-methyltransferase (glyoxalase superfamily)
MAQDLWSAIVVSPNGNSKLNEILASIEDLSVDERAKVAHKLFANPGLNVIIGNNNNCKVSGSIFFQINALDNESLNEIFDKLDTQAIARLLAAISDRIAREP